MNTVSINGKQVRRGDCVVPDHNTMTFTITVRAIGVVTPGQVKAQLQKKWEVTECRGIDHTLFVR